MANDIDMWNDMEELERNKTNALDYESDLMHQCYVAKFIEGDTTYAEKLKEAFIKKFGYWGNYY